MARRGVEEKLPWRAVPPAVRQEVETRLGAPITRGERVWGGYAPSVTLRLWLTDGHSVFMKAVNASSNDFMRRALRIEERVYRELGEAIGAWAPRLYGAFELDDWHGLLLEDLGGRGVLPWTPANLRQVAHDLAAFHAAGAGIDAPPWVTCVDQQRLHQFWNAFIEDPREIEKLSNVAGPASASARAWLTEHAPALSEASKPLGAPAPESTLLHHDVRSDNVLLVNGHARLVDWNWLCRGPAELDLAAFAQSARAEGGPDPERIVAWYEEAAPIRPSLIDASVAGLAGYFATAVLQPPIPELPRLRTVQSRQLKASLTWAAGRFNLPPPDWVDELATDSESV